MNIYARDEVATCFLAQMGVALLLEEKHGLGEPPHSLPISLNILNIASEILKNISNELYHSSTSQIKFLQPKVGHQTH